MKRLVDRFAEEAGSCKAVAQLRALLDDVCLEFGFKYFALLHHASLRHAGTDLVRIDNYPDDWTSELSGSKFVADDPVHLASQRASVGFSWSRLGDLVPLSQRHESILSRSRHFGLGAGFTVPVNVPGEPAGSCSFAVAPGVDLPNHRLLCAELVGAHAFTAARRIHDFPDVRVRPHLSPREVDCLRLVALGKTDWEISRILGISLETARQYVKSARAAYGVATRSQLVAAGLRDGWIKFEEALPRSVQLRLG